MTRILLFLTIGFLSLAACTPTYDDSALGADGKPKPKVYKIRAGETSKLQFRMLDSVNALRQADVVVFDALVEDSILSWAPQAEHIYAGKRGGKPSAKQRDISLRLVELAKAGKRVLRLKGALGLLPDTEPEWFELCGASAD